MPRTTPPDRLEKLIAVAAMNFVKQGFQRTQMDDVADDLGVSKGTVYRAVESKEALLAAVLVYGDDGPLLQTATSLETSGLAILADDLANQLAAAMSGLKLSTALESRPQLTEHTVQDLALDCYRMLEAHRVRIMVLDRCAPEVPALTGEWYGAGRYALVDLWFAYLKRSAAATDAAVETGTNNEVATSNKPNNKRTNEPQNERENSSTRTNERIEVTARTIVELLSLWAVKMPWDPQPRTYSPETPTIVASIVSNLVETTIIEVTARQPAPIQPAPRSPARNSPKPAAPKPAAPKPTAPKERRNKT